MKQITTKHFLSLLDKGGFQLVRTSGSHFIYQNTEGQHISVPIHKDIKSVIALKLIKRYSL